MDPLIVVLILLVICSAYFSATETAFSCLNKVKVMSMANMGNKRAQKVLKIVDNYDKFITNVLIGNNIVNIVATAIATVFFTNVIADESLAATITTVVMTLVILTFGEILPKSLAKGFSEKFAFFSAPIISVISIIFTPLSALFLVIQKLFKKILKTSKEPVTDEELITMVDVAENSGGIDKENSELIKSAVEFNDVIVGDIVTPRVDIVAVEKNSGMEQIFSVFKKSGFSRLPVYDKTVDNIIGFIHEKNFFFSMHDKKDNILDIIQPVVYVQEQVKVDSLLKNLQKKATHICVVLDEFGGTVGIVTLEDCLEELVGEIYDESDSIEENILQTGDNEFVVDGNAELFDLFEKFDFQQLTEKFESHSVGGWVCEVLGLFPNKGATFDFENLHVEVLAVVRHRITKIKVTIIQNEQNENK
jgi:putative hemolysin